MAEHPETLLKTMVEKELGLTVEEGGGSPLQGALVMGAAFGLGAVPPHPAAPVRAARGGRRHLGCGHAAVLFGIGVVKSRWTHRSWWSSGLEILAIGAVAGVAGYFFGSILPLLLGAPEAAT